ncbi:hypothetical protein [Actinoplanes sp. NPDC051851]|uniref:hypothetical protein n=1 Tax=Actinoplanes sp. NPDC051851 TaxID=3154753 RepID=UPI0034344EE6
MTTPRGARIIYGDPSQIAGRPWTKAFSWLVLAAAAGVDIVTFYQVLVLVLNVPDELVIVSVVGFAAVALALAHHAGLQARQALDPRTVAGSRTIAVIAAGGWALLGAVAFLVRIVLEDSTGSGASQFTTEDGLVTDLGAGTGTAEHYLPALLFLVLYLATGLVAALAAYFRQDPAAVQFNRAAERRSKTAREYADTRSRYARAKAVLDAIAQARRRREDAIRQLDGQFDAAARMLHSEAQLRLSRSRAAAGRRPPVFYAQGFPVDPAHPPLPTDRGLADPTLRIPLIPPAAPLPPTPPRGHRPDDPEETP